MTKKSKFGKLPARYSFALNPYRDCRFTRCPKCNQPNVLRKFVLLIHIEGLGLVSLGKTCRFCPRCEFIIAHQDDLESELVNMLEPIRPEVIGNPYLVLGTVERNVWRKGLNGERVTHAETREHTADFKKYYTVGFTPGGWAPAKDLEPVSGR